MNMRGATFHILCDRGSRRWLRSLLALVVATTGALALGVVTSAAGTCAPGTSGLLCYDMALQGDVWEQLTPFGAALDLTAGVPVLDTEGFPLAILPPDGVAAKSWTSGVGQCAFDGLNTACAPFAAGDSDRDATLAAVRWSDSYAADPNYLPFG